MKEELNRKKISRKKLDAAIIKKALGYDFKEVVEEYVGKEDGEIVLSKKKVTIKNVPPDMSAIKMLIGEEPSVWNMTDEELLAEKERLLEKLKEDEIEIKNQKEK